MSRRNTFGTALVVLAIVLFTIPAFFPVQPMLVHDTDRTANEPPDELEADQYEIVAYENLSDRGQELYVNALENGGEYRVPLDEGAPEFRYLTQEERRQAYQNDNQSAVRPIVIERPEDDSDLPRADERYYGPDPDETNATEEDLEERRQAVMRYDAMETATAEPPLGATPQLMRLAAVLLAVLSLGVGGYLLSSK